MAPTHAEPVETSAEYALEEIGAFRVEVWASTGGLSRDAFPRGTWLDDDDLRARHWIVRGRDGRLDAAARLTLHTSLDDVSESHVYREWGLRLGGLIAAPARIVVRPSARGRGWARKLLAVREEAARRAGASYAVCQAARRMVPILLSRGWTMVGPAAPDPRFPTVDFTVALKNLRETTADAAA